MSKTVIVTLTYNNPKLVHNLSESLYKHLPFNGWTHLIRDNSDNEETAQLKLGKNSKLVRAKNEGNFAKQHNDLMRDGFFDDYEFLCMLNDDTVAVSDFLTPMREYFSDSSIGAVGATLFYPDSTLQHCGVAFFEGLQPFNINQGSHKKLGLWPSLPNFDREYKAVTGACLMMRVSDYKALKGMDENFEWCFDDVDLCLRLGFEMRKRCVTSAQAKLIHIENFSTLKKPTNLKPSFKTAWPYLLKKHGDNVIADYKNYSLDYGKVK